MFCDELEVILPSKALSTATLMSIGADKIIMTKQATLGPIDPSTNSPFNPQFPVNGSGNTVPMSVEYLSGYLDLAKETVGEDKLLDAFMRLSETVHPLALGNAYRIRRQIKMLAKRMLQHHIDDEERIEKIISFLCSESGSHDYTINRREAAGQLGLPAQNPSAEEYTIIKNIYADISDELKLTEPFNADIELGGRESVKYTVVHGLLESVEGGCHRNVTEGILSAAAAPNLPSNQVTYRGWKHEEA